MVGQAGLEWVTAVPALGPLCPWGLPNQRLEGKTWADSCPLTLSISQTCSCVHPNDPFAVKHHRSTALVWLHGVPLIQSSQGANSRIHHGCSCCQAPRLSLQCPIGLFCASPLPPTPLLWLAGPALMWWGVGTLSHWRHQCHKQAARREGSPWLQRVPGG